MLTYVLYTVIGFISLLIAHAVHFNWIIGSLHAHFSYSALVLPAFIKHFGILGALLLYAIKAHKTSHLYSYIVAKSGVIFSAHAYSKINFMNAVFIPAFCMIAFIIHPIGNSVYFYSFYWFLPMILYVFFRKYIFAQALIAAFLSHALGSVIWLYAYQLDAPYWIAALPIVPFERIFMAMGIVVCDKIYTSIFNFLKKYKVHYIS